MSDSSIYEEGVVIICAPDMEESSRRSMGVKWCFKCRGRHEFDWVVLTPTTLDGWYWGPTAHSECHGCHQQAGELFPGWSYRWEDE